MVYNTNLLVSIAQCDTYINELNGDLINLNYRRSNLQLNIDGNTSAATTIPGQLELVETMLTTRQGELAVATDVAEQNRLNMELNSLENRRYRLQNRLSELSSTGVIDKQYSIALIDAEIVALTEFKTTVEGRKAELQSSANAA
jgi:hypothetical protein